MTELYGVRGVTKHYGAVLALDDVTLGVNAGEVLGLVGDNGAGKSTLVKVLSGAHQPDAGEILLEGVPCVWRSPQDAIKAGVETLYQDSGLAPDLSVSANLFLGREIVRHGLLGKLGFLSNKEMDAAAMRELERIGISVPPSGRTVSRLSGGQRQAVAIGRAVAWASKVILLDEPTNHLGAKQSREVLSVIQQAKNNGLGVIFISHTLPHVLEITDRIVVLRLGRVEADAPTSSFDGDSLVKIITGISKAKSQR